MGGRWARLAVAVVTASLVTACSEQSRVAPDAEITVSGTALGTDGSPLAGRPVRLGGGISVSEGAFAALTLGLSCTSGECTGDVVDGTTDGDGVYGLTLTGADTQSTFGEALSQLLSVSGPPADDEVSGASVTARFRIQTEAVRLPALQLVDPGVALHAPADVDVRWNGVAPGPYDVTFEEVAAVPVWRITTNDTQATVDARILEDTAGRVVVAGQRQDAVEGSDVEIRWRSPGVGYAAAVGAPPSRGRPCEVVGAGATPTSPCGLTDGDLVRPAALPPASPVVIDLAEPVPAELVVVRGCVTTCMLETSADGSTFVPAPVAAGDFAAVALDGAPIVAVRITAADTGSALREVSVWGSRPETAALRAVGADDVEGFVAAPNDGGLPWTLVGIAVLLVVGGGIGLGFVLGRRRLA